jgi:hypothetical protein
MWRLGKSAGNSTGLSQIPGGKGLSDISPGRRETLCAGKLCNSEFRDYHLEETANLKPGYVVDVAIETQTRTGVLLVPREMV